MAAPISSWRVAGTKWERLGIACTCGMALEKQGGSYSQAYSQGNGLLRRGTEYPMFDGHGSERTVTSSNQTVTGTANYEAFGQVAGSTGSSASPYMYAGDWGYRNDGDAGLMHVGARYYDAQVGRFITRDTVLSEHPYLYCEHEPVGFVDPSGHFAVLLLAAIVIVGAALIGGCGPADPDPSPAPPVVPTEPRWGIGPDWVDSPFNPRLPTYEPPRGFNRTWPVEPWQGSTTPETYKDPTLPFTAPSSEISNEYKWYGGSTNGIH